MSPVDKVPTAPSQPAAREWFMARRKMDAYISFDDMEEYAQFVARQQTAAKDAEHAELREDMELHEAENRRNIAKLEAAERERDEAIELAAQEAEKLYDKTYWDDSSAGIAATIRRLKSPAGSVQPTDTSPAR